MIGAMMEHILGLVAALVHEMLESHSTIAREGVVQRDSYNAADGTISVIDGVTAAMFEDDGNEPLIHTRVPLASSHVGDQFGPIGGERVVLVPTQSGYIALHRHGPNDSAGALIAERLISHRNRQTKAVDVAIKLTNDGATAGDSLGGLLAVGGSLQSFSTAGGFKITLNDTTKQIQIVTPGGLSVTLDDNNASVSLGGTGLDATANALMRKNDGDALAAQIIAKVQAALSTWRAGLAAGGNAPPPPTIAAATATGSQTVRAL
jgi:hypothetical protein